MPKRSRRQLAEQIDAAGGWIGLAAEIILGAALFWRRVISGAWHHAAHASRDLVIAQTSPEIADTGALENDDAKFDSLERNAFETAAPEALR